MKWLMVFASRMKTQDKVITHLETAPQPSEG